MTFFLLKGRAFQGGASYIPKSKCCRFNFFFWPVIFISNLKADNFLYTCTALKLQKISVITFNPLTAGYVLGVKCENKPRLT